MGEIDFINYLEKNGAAVNSAYKSLDGNYVEEVAANDGKFYGTHFSFIEGTIVSNKNPEIWNDALFYEWGKTIGNFHKISVTYPKNDLRKDWLDYESSRSQYLPTNEFKQSYEKLLNEINSLPKTSNSYGLIHSDIHHGNFHYYNGKITVFDFDDSMYCYFIQDIAMVIYYSLFFRGYSEDEKLAEATRILKPFIEGYESEFTLDKFWFTKIGLFLRLRDFTLYSVLLQKNDGKDMDDDLRNILLDLESRIKINTPIVELEM
jgi:Ser/Thr protein kinase RdoA (MazF antagonist)